MVTRAAVEGQSASADQLRVSFRILVDDPLGMADTVAQDLMDAINHYLDGCDDTHEGEAVVVSFEEFKRRAGL